MSFYRQVMDGVNHAALSRSLSTHQPTFFETYSNSPNHVEVQPEEMVTTLKLG